MVTLRDYEDLTLIDPMRAIAEIWVEDYDSREKLEAAIKTAARSFRKKFGRLPTGIIRDVRKTAQ